MRAQLQQIRGLFATDISSMSACGDIWRSPTY
jgi:hypothetical protein